MWCGVNPLSRPWRAALFLALLLGLSACAGETDRSEFAGPDWSRGRLLGTAVLSNRPGLAWEAANRAVLVVWTEEEAGQMRLRFAQLDSAGQTVQTHPLPMATRHPSQPKLWCDGKGGIHLFWLDSEASSQDSTLYYVPIDLQGVPLASPLNLSPSGAAVTGYAVVQSAPATLDIFWSDGSQPSEVLYHTQVPLDNQSTVQHTRLGVHGTVPAAAADSRQQVHLVWYGAEQSRGNGILYARYDPRQGALSKPVWIATVTAGTDYPPEIGLDWQHAYILWSQERRGGGGGTPSAQTGCRSISLDDSAVVRHCSLALPITDRIRYAPAEGELSYRSLAQAKPVDPSAVSNYTYMPYPLPGQRQELAVVLSTRTVSPQGKGEVQIALCILRGGDLEGYQIAGQSRSASLRPIAVADDDGNIHLAWLDTAGFGRYSLYYASTAPRAKAFANRLTLADVLGTFAGKAWNTAAAFSFLPMLLVWCFPPLLLLVAGYLINPDRDMATRSGRLWLGGAVILYLAAKLWIVPSFLWYAPFVDRVPARFQDFVILGWPGIIAIGSFLAMRWSVRRLERKEILYGFAIFAAIDAVLSLVLYIPNAIT